MRRLIASILVAGALAATATLSGCPAAHDDYPGGTCKDNTDCFKGEVCMNASICVPAPSDMAMTLPPGDLAGQPPADLSDTLDASGDDL
jgi:hypothetical protein